MQMPFLYVKAALEKKKKKKKHLLCEDKETAKKSKHPFSVFRFLFFLLSFPYLRSRSFFQWR